jgi:hypothetical protein
MTKACEDAHMAFEPEETKPVEMCVGLAMVCEGLRMVDCGGNSEEMD